MKWPCCVPPAAKGSDKHQLRTDSVNIILKAKVALCRKWIGHFLGFHLQRDTTLLISSVDCKTSPTEQSPIATTHPTGMSKNKWDKRFPPKPQPAVLVITVWTAAAHLQQERYCLAFRFLGHPSAALMRDWQTALGFAAKSPKTLDATTPSVLWDSGQRRVLATGASQQPVMT